MRKSLPDVLSAITRELVELSEQLELLQNQLSPTEYSGLDVQAFQNLDVITQTLSSLSKFLSMIEPELDRTWSIPTDKAIEQVCLSALAMRLCKSASTEMQVLAHECELF